MGAIIETPIFYEKLTARENLELHCEYMDTIGIIEHGRLLKEVDMNTVHSTNEEYVELVCKDAKTALCILEMKLGIKNMKLMGDNTIRIYDNTSTISQISKELGMNNIELESISQKKTSLEEYFFKLTKGGEIHV